MELPPLVSSTKWMTFFSAGSSSFPSVTCMLMPSEKKSNFSSGNRKGCQQFQNGAVYLSQAKLCLKEKSWYPVYRWGPWMLGAALGFPALWHVAVIHCLWHRHVLASKPCQKSWKKPWLLLGEALNSQLASFKRFCQEMGDRYKVLLYYTIYGFPRSNLETSGWISDGNFFFFERKRK